MRGLREIEFAQRLESTKGKRDGLYWETRPGERQSPIGPLVAEARAAGYTKREPGKRAPYHGYLYRLLLAQGPDAPGGAYNYVVKGHMIGGFALVAYPATYGVSGIMTFLVKFPTSSGVCRQPQPIITGWWALTARPLVWGAT